MSKLDLVKLSKFVTKIFETPSKEFSEWFGYYNYDTLNYNQTRMLCNRSTVDGCHPHKGMTIELGYYDLRTGEWHHIGESDSWNWQQGAMLQWMPGKGNESKVIYNSSKGGCLVSIVHDVETGDERVIDWPIYGITPDGRKSISLDLERSYWCRAYHYQSVANKSKDGRIYENDGIYEIDLDNNSKKRIISIQDIIKSDYRPLFENQKHWVEHIMINPSGTRFCFLHRFSSADNVMDYTTRLMVANIDGSGLQCINGWDKVRWSHFGWCKDDAFAIYTYVPGTLDNVPFRKLLTLKGFSLTTILKRLILKKSSFLSTEHIQRIGGPTSYYQFYKLDTDNIFKQVSVFDSKECRIDGHPSFTDDGRFMITDTYPNKKSWQKLYVYDIENKSVKTLCDFFAYYRRKPSSCDLHPKLCHNNNYVVVDTAHDEKHHMVLFKLNWDKMNER